jgi:hypothetical protein
VLRERLALSIVGALLVIVAFLVFAPVVPFEQLQEVQVVASSSSLSTFCSNPSNVTTCSPIPTPVFKQAWVRSYGSVTFDAFGFGTSPFASPVRFTMDGVTNVFVLNSTGFVVEQLAYPSDVRSEPVSLIGVESMTVLSSPFGGTGVSVELANHGVDENADVSVYPYPSTSLAMVNDHTIGAGQSAVYNITSWTTSPPKPGDNLRLAISGDLCYGQLCFFYMRIVSFTVGPSPSGTSPPSSAVRGGTGSVWLVGASSADPSALPNTGVRSTIQVINQETAGPLAFWVSDGLSNDLWGQVGYFISGGGSPVGFYQVWNLTSDVLMTSGTTSVNVGNSTFAMYLQSGTTWAFAIDGNVFATYDMGAKSSSTTFPVYALSEEQGNSTFSFQAVGFAPAIEVLRSGSWSPVNSASAYGTAWGVEGSLQNGRLGIDQLVVGGNLAKVAKGTMLWNSIP